VQTKGKGRVTANFYVSPYLFIYLLTYSIGVRWGRPSFVSGRKGVGGRDLARGEGGRDFEDTNQGSKGGSLPPHLQASGNQVLWRLQRAASPSMFLHSMFVGQVGFTE
jgi:hypothetical protein